MSVVTLRNTRNGLPVGTNIVIADTSLTRLFGLLGKKGLEAGHGLWIKPSSGVHTFAMRFPIDVVALDKGLRVVGVWPNLKPWRATSISFKIHSVLEFAAGHIHANDISVGDQFAKD